VFSPLSAPKAAPPEDSKETKPVEKPGDDNVNRTEPVKQPTPPTDDAASDPRVEDLIKDLEAQRAVPRALTPNPAVPAQEASRAPAAPDVPAAESRVLTPEGTVLVFRRGRLVRLKEEGGRIAFAFDNDLNSPAPSPMIIQPCAQLQRLEALAAVRGDALSLKVSGRVLTYQGSNYLLPTFVQVLTPGEVVPMQ